MKELRTEDIKEIAEQLDCGFRAFLHKTTGQMLFIPNEYELPDIEFDAWKEELELLKKTLPTFSKLKNGLQAKRFKSWKTLQKT